ncbi:hypothetical protein ACIBM8_00590 [Micromonospora aurantiaca]|uniref:hypothetical protein n=1 Tax=Micromonospora aurantiaca (nom. illeg.) TaxID=47850 RepID=UPI0037A8FA39
MTVLRRLGAAGTVCVVAACGPSTADPADRPAGDAGRSTAQATGTPTTGTAAAVPATGGAGYSAALSARLVTTDALPPGFTVDIATVMDSDTGRQRPGPEVPCTDMIPLLSASRLTGTPSAMADLRAFISRCPAVASPNQGGGGYRFAVVPGPRLGDESMRVRLAEAALRGYRTTGP